MGLLEQISFRLGTVPREIQAVGLVKHPKLIIRVTSIAKQTNTTYD